MNNKTWQVAIGSCFNAPQNIAVEDILPTIKRIFNYLIDVNSEHCKFKVESRSSDVETSEQADWQYSKMDEIAKKSVEGLVVEIKKGTVSCQSKFNIEFPSDWEKEFVLDWTLNHGMGELSMATVMESSENKMKFLTTAMPEEIKIQFSNERTIAKLILLGVTDDTIALKTVTPK
jgi:hypothetical protein